MWTSNKETAVTTTAPPPPPPECVAASFNGQSIVGSMSYRTSSSKSSTKRYSSFTSLFRRSFNSSKTDEQTILEADDMEFTPSLSPIEQEPKQPNYRVEINPLMHGTISQSGGVEVIFYDACQGDENAFAAALPEAPSSRVGARERGMRRNQVTASSMSSSPRQQRDLPHIIVRGGSALIASDPNAGQYFHDSMEKLDIQPPQPRPLHSSQPQQQELQQSMLSQEPPPPPPPPKELPLRFLRAGKGDPEEGMRRYEASLQWRKDYGVDTILRKAQPNFELIKQHYHHFCHLKGKNGEPCFYEQPPKTNLKALRNGGVTVDELLQYYAMIQEFHWQMLERDDMARSLYIIDLNGIRLGDFVGEVIDFVKKASQFTGQHYPERAGCVFVINVPGWFKLIWNVVKPWIDEATLQKIYILRGKDEIRTKMQEKIDIGSLPPEYGGQSMSLGQSPQEQMLSELMKHNNDMARTGSCPNGGVGCGCKFCTWAPARSY